MKKLYIFLTFLLATTAANAQCVIDATHLSSPGMYPAANHVPHIVADSLYDQTIQGLMPTGMDFGGFASATIDSIRLDSITGLPAGITWVKNPNVILGGGYGCVEFTGTTSDSAKRYNLNPFGTVWAHLSVPLLGINTDTFQTGSLNRPPFNGFYLVVDSAPQPLSATINSNNVCFGQTNGDATVFAAGGSPVSPYLYKWNIDSTSYTVTNLGAGTYTVTVYSGTDSATASVTIAAPSAPITGTTSSVGSNGNNGVATVSVTGGQPPYRYRWNGGGRTDTITGLAPGTYTVRVTDSTGCVFTDSVIVQDLTGITTLSSDFLKLNLFPNPANAVLNVSIATPKAVAMQVEAIDMTGRVVYASQMGASNEFNFAINLDKFNTGVYVLQLTVNNQSARQRFVVTH